MAGFEILDFRPCSGIVVAKTVYSILMLLIFAGGSAAAEPKVLALQSVSVAPYELAVKGFTQTSGSVVQRLLISDLQEKDILRSVRRLRPDMVLAVGRDALLQAQQIKTVPVVYCMVLHPQALLLGEKNIRGVSMNLPPEKQLGELLRVLPEVRSINLLYDPERSGVFVQRLREAAAKMNMKLTARSVRRSRDVPLLLNEMKGRIGIYWMLPDATVITPETLETLFLFSLENKMPVLTFADQYLELGATLSIGIDPFDIGCQTGRVAQKILSGNGVEKGRYLDARKAVVTVNEKVALKLGVTLDQEVLKNNHGGH